MDVEKELKHWGILGMKWGIRRYQNEDGSLTAAGRERYGVGNNKKDASTLSDEELRKMTKRYRNQAEYYQARNDSIYKENEYKRLTTPPKKESTFLKNVFVKPLESFMAKNAEFAYGAIGYAVLGGADSDFATAYFNSITNSRIQTKEKKDPEKEEYEKKQKEYNRLKLENDIAAEQLRKTDPHISETRTSKGGKITTYYEQLDAYYEAKQKYEDARVSAAETLNTTMSDFYKPGGPAMTPDQQEALQRELDEHLERYGIRG